jgi:hypothetical protein
MSAKSIAAPRVAQTRELPAPSAAEASKSRGPFSAANLTTMLYRKVAPLLSREELEWILLDGCSWADLVARNASIVAENIGSLVQADGESEAPSGNFQSHHDVPNLLFHFSAVFEQLSGLAAIVGDAADQLASCNDSVKGMS